MNVYVVLSNVIYKTGTSNGMHGVYASKSSAEKCAISAITSIAQSHGHTITTNDLEISDYGNELYLNYANDVIDISVSCLEQEVRR